MSNLLQYRLWRTNKEFSNLKPCYCVFSSHIKHLSEPKYITTRHMRTLISYWLVGSGWKQEHKCKESPKEASIKSQECNVPCCAGLGWISINSLAKSSQLLVPFISISICKASPAYQFSSLALWLDSGCILFPPQMKQLQNLVCILWFYYKVILGKVN